MAVGSSSKSVSEITLEGKDALIDDDFELAYELFTQALLITPMAEIKTRADLFVDRSQAAFKLKKYSDALADANHGIDLDPASPKGYLRKAASYVKLGEFQMAKNVLEAGNEKAPGNPRFDTMRIECDAYIVAEENDNSVKAKQDLVDVELKDLYLSLLKTGYNKENAQFAMALIETVPKQGKEVPDFGNKDLLVIHDLVDVLTNLLSTTERSWLTKYEIDHLTTLRRSLLDKESILSTYLLQKNSGESVSEQEKRERIADIGLKADVDVEKNTALKAMKGKTKIVVEAEDHDEADKNTVAAAVLLDLKKDTEKLEPDQPETYCYCNQGFTGDMVACDNSKCKIEWFHYDCVNLTKAPKGKWYCSDCAGKQRGKKIK